MEIPGENIISQPFLTEEGYINPAAMNELTATITNIPKTYNRLAGDSEWNTQEWTFKHDIVGAFAKWVCRQSPYNVPDGLENVCKYLNVALKSCTDWSTADEMAKCSLVEINKWLYDILYEQGVEQFDAWNKCKKGRTPDIQFTFATDKRDLDYDFIDLDALLHNVCIEIRDERRVNKAFDEKFEKEQKL